MKKGLLWKKCKKLQILQKFATCPVNNVSNHSSAHPSVYTRSVALNFSSTCSAEASGSSVAYTFSKHLELQVWHFDLVTPDFKQALNCI